MKDKLNEKFHITSNGKILLSFFLKSTENGFLFGLIIPKRDIHLTVIFDKNRHLLQPHITDKNVPEGRREQPRGKHTEFSLIEEELIHSIKSWMKTYHFNRKGWILKPKVKQKIQELIAPKEKEEGVWKLPFYTEIELPDFNDENYWSQIRLRDMAGTPELIFLEYKIVPRYAFIIDEKRLLTFSENQFENLIGYILDEFGFEDYFTYIKRKVPRKEFLPT